MNCFLIKSINAMLLSLCGVLRYFPRT
jgi:hypothetical protein